MPVWRAASGTITLLTRVAPQNHLERVAGLAQAFSLEPTAREAATVLPSERPRLILSGRS